jgi:hypothetical protein
MRFDQVHLGFNSKAEGCNVLGGGALMCMHLHWCLMVVMISIMVGLVVL